MIRSIYFFVYFIILAVILILELIPYYILRILKRRNFLRKYILWTASLGARHIIYATGSIVNIYGLENLPEHDNLCFISNHQGLIDILLTKGYIPKNVGFIAKKELKKVPFLNSWMLAMNCIFIDRKNYRKSLHKIKERMDNINKGNPIVLYPEGTRSRGSKMGRFNPGGVKLAIKAGAVIVPLTINGTYKVFEEKNRICPAEITLTIHPAINTDHTPSEEIDKLVEKTLNQIKSALPA